MGPNNVFHLTSLSMRKTPSQGISKFSIRPINGNLMTPRLVASVAKSRALSIFSDVQLRYNQSFSAFSMWQRYSLFIIHYILSLLRNINRKRRNSAAAAGRYPALVELRYRLRHRQPYAIAGFLTVVGRVAAVEALEEARVIDVFAFGVVV